MRDREEDLQDAAVAYLPRIEGDLNRLGVAGLAARGHLVMRGRLLAAVVARDGAGHAVDMLKDALDAPETSAGDHRDLRPVGARRLIDRRRRNDAGLFRRRSR